jgi:uncharacterized membrane protein
MNRSLGKGCGCLLVVVSAVVMVVALVFAILIYQADVEAAENNQAAWEAYERQQPTIDSLEQAGVPDSVICQQYPRPVIRQGYFATAIMGFLALGVVVIAAFPLAIGCIMLVRYNRKNRDEELNIYNNRRQ